MSVPVELLRAIELLVQLDKLLLDDAEAQVEALVRQEEDVRDEVEAGRVRLSLLLARRRRCGDEAGLLSDIPAIHSG